MSTLEQFDLLFKDLFSTDGVYLPPTRIKSPHPLNIYTTPEGLFFEIACTGLKKEEVFIEIDGDYLNVKYEKPPLKEDKDKVFIHRGLSQSSFKLSYKISPKLNLKKSEAKMENGLLIIEIPYSESSKPKSLKIK